MERNTLFSEFVKAEDDRIKLKLTARIDEMLEFEETVIRKEYDKVSKDKAKVKRRRQYLTPEYEESFTALSRQEKVEYYKQHVELLTKLLNNTYEVFDASPTNKETDVYVKGYIHGWNKKTLRVNRRELCIELARPGKVKKHDLYNYLYRKSKNSEYFSFVLESINAVPKSKHKTIHLGFTNINTYNEWFEEVKATVDFARAKIWAQDLGVQITINNEGSGVKTDRKLSDEPKQIPSLSSQPVLKEEVPKPQPEPQKTEPVEPKTQAQQTKPTVIAATVAVETKTETQGASSKEPESKQPDPSLPSEAPPAHIEKKQSNLVDRIIKEEIEAGQLQNLPTEYDEAPPEKKPNLLSQILPEYDLKNLGSDQCHKTLEYENKYRLLQNTTDPQSFKIFMNFSFPAEVVFSHVTNLQTFRNWNTEVDEIAVKTLIASENTAILYLKIKAYSRIYRARDFVFLRHAFRNGADIYLIDKSIENVNYPPFLTIVRGKLQTVWGFLPNADNSECLLVIDCKLDHQGYINQEQNTNLSVQYLKKLLNIQSYIVQKSFKKDDSLNGMFDVGPPLLLAEGAKNSPVIKPKLSGEILVKQSSEQELARMASMKTKDSWYSAQGKANQPQTETNSKEEVAKKPQQEDKGQIPQDELNQQAMSNTLRVPELDSEGLAIINPSFLTVKHKVVPWQRELAYETNYVGHHIWRDEWKVDTQSGGCWFVHQQKMAEQRKVFSYILSKMGKNLLSGKGILNISLPVDVFSMESNLEAIAKSFAFSPILLEKAATLKQPLEQMKYVIAFGFTCSLLYIKMEKPFNPILGETLQCSFKGCPMYLEQVSHHPPIASLYMVGRGFRMSGSIESKMDLSINSGTGYNAGDVVVRFDNGTEVRFRTPGGQISGLTYGQRKLVLNNKCSILVNQAFYWEPNLGYMADINFNPGKKGFWSMSKQQIPADYFEGVMKKVRKEFIAEFAEKKSVFKPSPTSKDILEEHYKITGQWTKEVLIDDKVFYAVEADRYAKYEVDPHPLPSDCMYREDVVYKRLGNIARSQNEKERLEVLQRKDRKLREKKR